MRARLTSMAAALVLTGAALVSTPTAAQAAVTPGAYCAKADQGKVRAADDGDRYECRMDGRQRRWKPVSTGRRTPVTGASPVTESGPYVPTPTRSATAGGDVDVPPGGGAQPAGGIDDQAPLPLTGGDAGLATAIGGGLLGLGALALLVARRRTRFTA